MWHEAPLNSNKQMIRDTQQAKAISCGHIFFISGLSGTAKSYFTPKDICIHLPSYYTVCRLYHLQPVPDEDGGEFI